jgi:chromosome segregation ATPase
LAETREEIESAQEQLVRLRAEAASLQQAADLKAAELTASSAEQQAENEVLVERAEASARAAEARRDAALERLLEIEEEADRLAEQMAAANSDPDEPSQTQEVTGQDATSAGLLTPPKPAEVMQGQDPAPSRGEIARAVRAAPGLNTANSSQIKELERLLAAGTCAPEALKTALGNINRHTLVSLIRDLGPC